MKITYEHHFSACLFAISKSICARILAFLSLVHVQFPIMMLPCSSIPELSDVSFHHARLSCPKLSTLYEIFAVFRSSSYIFKLFRSAFCYPRRALRAVFFSGSHFFSFVFFFYFGFPVIISNLMEQTAELVSSCFYCQSLSACRSVLSIQQIRPRTVQLSVIRIKLANTPLTEISVQSLRTR